jgi:hypothetical protein
MASAAIVGVAVASQKASSKLSARVLPKHINPVGTKHAKYKWTAHGTLTHGQYCPNGANVFPYCETLPKSKACKGTVTWTTSLGKDRLLADSGKKIGSGKTAIKGNCTYAFSHKFPTNDFIADKVLGHDSALRHVGVIFRMTFTGNSFLNSSKARRQVVIAKVLEQGS